jgi:1,2-diacylglycerol 3-beta-galactosyltransferase
VDTYKHMSAHPRQWRILYHGSNTKFNEVVSNFHSKFMSGKAIKNRIQEYNPDVIVSVHPTMNHTPLIQSQKVGKELDKHIPFFTVVTDLGSGHCMWFERRVNKLYVASERLYKLARRRGGTPKENIVMAGLPIRHGFAVQAEKLGDRTKDAGKEYQKEVRGELGIDPDKKMILVMGGGEGVGSLSDIVNALYAKFSAQGVDATICVVCGRNEKLKNELAARDWDAVVKEIENKPKRRKGILRFLRRSKRSKKLEEMVHRDEESEATEPNTTKGDVDVIGLGFVTNMPEYMAAANVLVSKAGPGTIAEAASVGLPIMLTR